MPLEQRLILAFGLALCVTLLATPLAIWVAHRTGFLDHPKGYKGHARATPYLGGMALGLGIVLPAILFGEAALTYSPIALCAAALWVVGTVDDRIGLHPLTRVVVEVTAAVILWVSSLGWEIPGGTVVVLGFTIVWVVGLVNAYNLMDNMDGAAGSVGCASAAGLALLAAVGGNYELAALSLAVAGACAGFLFANLASPSRIFLGDGGSMPLGFFIAAIAMSVPVPGEMGVLSVAALAPVAGVVILDTLLVVVSRRRRGVMLMSGGRDHLTHRLRRLLPSPRAVALTLAAAQAALCALALGMTHLGEVQVAVAAALCLGGLALAVWVLERPALTPAWNEVLEWAPAAAEAPPAAGGAAEQPLLVPAAQEQ